MRIHGWEERLAAFIRERMHMPFSWGGNDCCLFAADAAIWLTGIDPASGLRGSYSHEAGALEAIRRECGPDAGVRDIAIVRAAAAGFAEISPSMAWRGDWMLIEREGAFSHAIGVCVGERLAVPGPSGLILASRGRAVMAWRVE